MKGWTPLSVLIAVLVTAVLAAPAAAAQGTEGLPTDLWDSAPAEPSAQEGSSSDVHLILILSLLAAASVTGFAFVIARAGARAKFHVVAGRGQGREIIERWPSEPVPPG